MRLVTLAFLLVSSALVASKLRARIEGLVYVDLVMAWGGWGVGGGVGGGGGGGSAVKLPHLGLWRRPSRFASFVLLKPQNIALLRNM